jgi:hypothetical protein
MGKAYEQYQDAQTQSSWPDFLSRHGYLFNHFLLRTTVEAGAPRNEDGKYYDAWATVEKLSEVERLQSERAAKKAAERRIEGQPQGEEASESLRQTRGGILLPGHIDYKGSKDLKQ